jgi:hypothetical protein
MFNLARALKDRPELVWSAPRELKPIVRSWHELSPANCRVHGFDADWRLFTRLWRKVRLPVGEGPLQQAWQAAMTQPLPPEAEIFEGDRPMERLVGLCFQLQKHAGDKDFPLACRVAGQLLGVCFKTASDMLGSLEGAGILVRTFTGSAAKAKANRYKYGSLARW